MRRLLAILTAAALLAGCSRRERANPFDPLNPSTRGRPAGFEALAGDGQVLLHWQAVFGDALSGYQLTRRGPGETVFQPVGGVLGLSVTAFRDVPLANDRDYNYQLYFVFQSGPGSRPAEDTATPGSAVPWLIESGGTDLVQGTPDDRHVVARRGGFTSTADVAVSTRDGAVWVADEGAGRVAIYRPQDGVTTTISRLSHPRAVAVDAFDGSGWVCDLGQNLVLHYRANGDAASLPIAPLVDPVDVAVDPQDGSVWVCELGADRVGRYESTSAVWKRTVSQPARVAVDSTTREGWVTSYGTGTITHLSFAGDLIGRLTGFRTPLGVAVDARRGRIWIADPGAGQVIALRRDESEEFRVTGLTDAGELAVDARTGDAWVVLAASGQLVRVSPDGAIRRMGGLRNPIAVAVDAGGR